MISKKPSHHKEECIEKPIYNLREIKLIPTLTQPASASL